ncbi:hypothetical protein GOV10_01210 [Candidatus Woesearchaeota archaeon]|nr:hypothetical protein [Candidatus Woesearchaeota archaeon]
MNKTAKRKKKVPVKNGIALTDEEELITKYMMEAFKVGGKIDPPLCVGANELTKKIRLRKINDSLQWSCLQDQTNWNVQAMKPSPKIQRIIEKRRKHLRADLEWWSKLMARPTSESKKATK